ncbi:MAG: GPI anchored serine-threonine rich family protein [Planctomycetota bacterium]|nr:GPI anchored serine-threonine rich family protein [Planctomycetota bacterium]
MPILSLLALVLAFLPNATAGEEPRPSFPDRTMKVPVHPQASEGVGARNGVPEPTIPPFSWDQTVLTREGSSITYSIQGYDPNYNPIRIVKSVPPAVEFTLNPENFGFTTMQVLEYLKNQNSLGITVPTELPPNFSDTMLFDVHVGEVSDAAVDYPFTVAVQRIDDLRPIRARPGLTRSAGEIVRPGNVIRYQWSGSRTQENFPEYRYQFAGRTLAAETVVGTVEDFTVDQAVKVRPVVLGHYLMLVTPWDTFANPIEQRRGTQSNGQVFRCAFGSDNLAPVGDGFLASTFFPASAAAVTGVLPNAVDPETGTDTYAGSTIDWGDGTTDALDTHAYAEPGIYKAVAQVEDPDDGALFGAVDDLFFVDAVTVRAAGPGAPGANPRLTFRMRKQITVDEGGIGEEDKDTFTMRWIGIGAGAGDRIVFAVNRNRFGRMHTDPDPGVGELDDRIVLNARRTWTGTVPNAQRVTVRGTANSLTIAVSKADLDRTADPRMGGVEVKDDFLNQVVAVCIVPADYPSSPVRCFRMDPADVLRLTLTGGRTFGAGFDPESRVSVSAYAPKPTLKLLDPNGGETLTAGDTFTVTWKSLGAVGNVDLELSEDNGKTWIALATNIANDGTEDVTIPNVLTNRARVRVKENVDGKPNDRSDKQFVVLLP